VQLIRNYRLAALCVTLSVLAGCCCDDSCDGPGADIYGNPFASQHVGIDPPCYGYHSTCWRAWPSDCANCPPEHAVRLPAQMQSVIETPTIPQPAIDSSPPPESLPAAPALPRREPKGITPPDEKPAEKPADPPPPPKPEQQIEEDQVKPTGRFPIRLTNSAPDFQSAIAEAEIVLPPSMVQSKLRSKTSDVGVHSGDREERPFWLSSFERPTVNAWSRLESRGVAPKPLRPVTIDAATNDGLKMPGD
jgi:hypothetical protein